MTALSSCAHCQKPLRAHFSIKRVDGAGTETGVVSVCSILCLIQWAYTYGTVRGVQGAMLVKQTLKSLIGAVKGG